MKFKGIIIKESLADKSVLSKVEIEKTKVEKVTPKHKTPWLSQWTLHTVSIEEVKKLGCTHVRLDTFTSNKKAQDIYHKYGFIDNTIEMYKKI